MKQRPNPPGRRKQEAEAARVASEAKVARLALHVDKEDAGRVLGELNGL